MHNNPSFKPAQGNKEDFYSGAVFNKTNFLLYENQIQKMDFKKKEIIRNSDQVNRSLLILVQQENNDPLDPKQLASVANLGCKSLSSQHSQ